MMNHQDSFNDNGAQEDLDAASLMAASLPNDEKCAHGMNIGEDDKLENFDEVFNNTNDLMRKQGELPTNDNSQPQNISAADPNHAANQSMQMMPQNLFDWEKESNNLKHV